MLWPIKSKILPAILAIMAAGSAVAQDSDNLPPPQNKTDFSNMMDSLSNLLSSTNPRVANNLAPGAGDSTISATNPSPNAQRVNNLPPLVEQPVAQQQQPIHLPPLPPLIQPPAPIQTPIASAIAPEPIDNLSPAVKNILSSSPSGLGNHPVQSARGKITIEHGRFEDGQKPDININKIDTSNKSSKFDIKVQNSRRSDSENEILENALSALNAQQYTNAINLYKTALKRDPHSRDAMFGLATSYLKSGQKDEARDAYVKLLKAYPKDKDGLNNLLVLASREAPGDALKQLDKLSTKDPNFAPVYAQKAFIYSNMNNFAAAKQNFIKALNIEPNNVNYQYNLAITLDKMGDVKNASKIYYQLLQESAKGAQLPVDRQQISDRMAFIGSQKVSNN